MQCSEIKPNERGELPPNSGGAVGHVAEFIRKYREADYISDSGRYQFPNSGDVQIGVIKTFVTDLFQHLVPYHEEAVDLGGLSGTEEEDEYDPLFCEALHQASVSAYRIFLFAKDDASAPDIAKALCFFNELQNHPAVKPMAKKERFVLSTATPLILSICDTFASYDSCFKEMAFKEMIGRFDVPLKQAFLAMAEELFPNNKVITEVKMPSMDYLPPSNFLIETAKHLASIVYADEEALEERFQEALQQVINKLEKAQAGDQLRLSLETVSSKRNELKAKLADLNSEITFIEGRYVKFNSCGLQALSAADQQPPFSAKASSIYMKCQEDISNLITEAGESRRQIEADLEANEKEIKTTTVALDACGFCPKDDPLLSREGLLEQVKVLAENPASVVLVMKRYVSHVKAKSQRAPASGYFEVAYSYLPSFWSLNPWG